MLWLHRYGRVLAGATLALIAAGGLVTSTGSGLAVPDWPTTYGYFMFSFPLSYMVGGIFYEHGHRLIASVVGLLTIGMAIWVQCVDQRPRVRRLAWMALVAVITQGVLGGITVLYFLPAPVSVGHAGLAQLFFVLVVSLAVMTSPGWMEWYGRDDAAAATISADRPLQVLATALPCVVYLQIIAGATMRHTGAGLAIPDFPLAFGGVIPMTWDSAIAINYAHRVGAVLVAGVLCVAAARILGRYRARQELVRPTVLLLAVAAIQITLGAWTVWSERHVVINTAHVTVGALLLGTTVTLALRVHRSRFADSRPARRAEVPAGRIVASALPLPDSHA